MKVVPVLALAWLATLSGCTVTAVTAQDDTRPNNTCQNDDGCGNRHCSQGVCQALNGQLEGLLVTVTPASDSSVPHLTFVTDVQDVPTSGGEQDLLLPGPSHLTGSLQLPPNPACYPTLTSDDPKNPLFKAPDGVSLPADVTLSLHQSLLGVPQQVYFAKTGNDLQKGGYSFDVQVPAGDYDVYLVPPRGQLDCPVPPQLVRSKSIKQGLLATPFQVAPISTLGLTIHWPKASAPLKNWIVDVIEPLGGRPISTEVTLGDAFDPAEGSMSVEYSAKLFYSAVVELAPTETQVQSAYDLLRLRPPAGVGAPTIFFERSGLGLFSGNLIDLTNFTRVPDAVKIEGQVASLDSHEPVSGSVTLISTAIAGIDQGVFASFQTTVQVGDDGLFDVELPPGQYRVQAVPPMPAGIPPVQGALSAIEVNWDIAADIPFQAGKLLELPALAEVTGQARVQGAQVQAVPSPQNVLPFDAAFGAGPFSPRASSALVDETGRFRMQADPGQFDVSVHASESLGFGWFVRAGVQVGAKTLDLGHTTLPLPSLVSGTVQLADSDLALSSAAIRAYAYLDKDLAYTRDPRQAVSVIAVAETRAEENGTFRLLLPSSIAAPK